MTLKNNNKIASCFNIFLGTTVYQTESFKIEYFTINNISYTSTTKLQINEDSLYSSYYIKSDILLPALSSTEIVFMVSYVCSPLDFKEVFRFNYPCYDFSMMLSANRNIGNYSIDKEIFSLLNNASSTDSVELSNIKSDIALDENYILDITFFDWSLPGSGYIIALKK